MGYHQYMVKSIPHFTRLFPVGSLFKSMYYFNMICFTCAWHTFDNALRRRIEAKLHFGKTLYLVTLCTKCNFRTQELVDRFSASTFRVFTKGNSRLDNRSNSAFYRWLSDTKYLNVLIESTYWYQICFQGQRQQLLWL